MKILGVIPARLGSTRLPEKVLLPVGGRPMIQRVWEQASRARQLSELIIACDDEQIKNCVAQFGGRAELTRKDHPNGSSRVAEIAESKIADLYVNIQGDEPLLDPEAIDRLVEVFLNDKSVQVATLAVRQSSPEDFKNSNVVKVVCDGNGDALYFSREPIPHRRESSEPLSFLKHLGIYAYRRDFLLKYVSWQQTQLEKREKLEQLRILEKGEKIRVVVTPYDSIGVDTLEDLKAVESKLKC